MAQVCVCDEYFTVNSDGSLCLVPGSQGPRDIVLYRSPGNYQFQKADYPWLARVRVRVQGAGGGSAGAHANPNECIVRQGGAGGGYSEALIDVSALGTVETVLVGAPGAAGTATTAGGDGDMSAFGGLVTALGGRGGPATQISGTSFDVLSGVSAPVAGDGQYAQGGSAGGGAFRLNGGNGMSGAGGESTLGHGGYARGSEGDGSGARGFGGGAGGGLSYGGAVGGAVGNGGIVIVELYG